MDLSKLQYHSKIILDAIFFIITLPILQFAMLVGVVRMTTIIFKNFSKIKWDFKTFFKHYWQFFSLFIMVFIVFQLFLTSSIALNILLYKLNNYGRIALLSYWIYVYHYHRTTHSLSQKIGSMAVRNNFLLFLLRHARSYFPVELVKTAELEPDRNYIIACFPHGIMGFGFVNNMIFNISEWISVFPRVRPLMATLDLNFFMPICRNVLHMLGLISVSKESLLHYLDQSNDPAHPDNKDGFTSNAIGIVVGGAREAEGSTPGIYKLVLKNRKGFVRIAIISGCSLVPSFSFGEVELFDQVFFKPGTLEYWFQNFLRKLFGIWPCLIVGRGFFQESFGLLPRRKRLVQVVGAPIDVIQCDTPSKKYVDEIHEKFIEALVEIFETHKKQYLDDYENVKLLFV